MGEERISTAQQATTYLSQLSPWRQALFERALRVLALVALPAAVIGGYYIFVTGEIEYLFLVLLMYGVLFAGGFLRRIPYLWRVWGVLVAAISIGVADLLVYGWGEDGRIYLLIAIMLSGLFLSGWHSLAVFIVSEAVAIGYVALVGLGVIAPATQTAAGTALTLFSGLIVFIASSTMLFVLLNNLLPRVYAGLQQSAQLATDLESRQRNLTERMRALQNANLSLQRRARYLDATTQVVQSLIAVFDLETLMERAVELIAQHFEALYVALYVPDESGRWLVLRAASSRAGRDLVMQGYRLDRNEPSVVVRVAESQRPYIVSSSGALALDMAHLSTNPNPSLTRSAAVLPLLLAGELVGVLDIHSANVDFDQDDLRTLQGLAWQLALVFDNARRLNAGPAILATITPFYRLAERLSAIQTEDDVYAAVLEIAHGFNPTAAYIVRPGTRPDSPPLVTELRAEHIATRLADNATENFAALLATGATLHSPLLIADIATAPALPLPGFHDLCADLLARSQGGGLALVPLRTPTAFCALLVAVYDTAHQFTPLETQFYPLLGELTGVTLERMRQVQEAQKQATEERWLREFGERLIQSEDWDRLVAQATRSLLNLTQADGVSVTLTLPEASAEQRGLP